MNSKNTFIITLVSWMLMIGSYCMATEGTILLNSTMPNKNVSVIATQSIVLKPGFNAKGTNGNFQAKIGTINSVYPKVTVDIGSTELLQKGEKEQIAVSGFNTKTIVPLVAAGNISALNLDNSLTSIEYIDGLGRPNMTVQKAITPNRKDVVSMVNYDCEGRPYQQWLPTPMEPTDNHEPGMVMQEAKNFYADIMPYTTISYDSDTDLDVDGLGVQITRPGAEWHNLNKTQLETFSTLNIRKYYVVDNNVVLHPDEIVSYVWQTTDEDGKVFYKCTDSSGKLLLMRMVDGSNNHDTYYVYDDLGRLRYCLTPEASDRMSNVQTYSLGVLNAENNPLAQFAFAYQYDKPGRCIKKKHPGRDWNYMVYDRAGRLAFSQDGNQRVNHQWVFYKYDTYNRLVQNGLVESESPLIVVQEAYDKISVVESYLAGVGYTSTTTDVNLFANPVILTQNFYDTYDFLNIPAYTSIKSLLTYNSLSGFDTQYVNPADDAEWTQGMLTGTAVAMLNHPTDVIVTAAYYDQKGRVVQSLSNNHKTGHEKYYVSYSFTGKPLKSKHRHKVNGKNEISEDYVYTYDAAERLLSTTHSINGGVAVKLNEFKYDELGRIVNKKLHAGIQSIDYSYNIQGWLKSIHSAQFSENLYYQDAVTGVTPCYNGNISAQKWGAGSALDKQYNYSDDELNRLTTATFSPDDIYTEYVSQYDKNGNILAMMRNGYATNSTTGQTVVTAIDDLNLSYSGNQLKAVTDQNNPDDFFPRADNDFRTKTNSSATKRYSYDANGNICTDIDKGIYLTKYNILNLPERTQFSLGHETRYSYDATGTKHSVTHITVQNPTQIPLGGTTFDNTYVIATTDTTYYCGNFIYENGVLQRILTSDGYIQTSGSGNTGNWKYVYLLRDHLGNTRAQITSSNLETPASTAYTVTGVTDYYPFGMEITPNSIGFTNESPYLYGAKELDRMHELQLYDFHARMLDNTIPGFTTPDPLAEQHPWESPYQFCGNNPVNRIDPTGLDWYAYSKGVAWFENMHTHEGFSYNNENYKWIGEEVNVVNTAGDRFFGDMYGNLTKIIDIPEITVTPDGNYFNYLTGGGGGSGVAEDINSRVVDTWDPGTNERIQQLDPRVQGPAMQFINQVESDLGVQLRITQGYRSFAEQDALYAKGRTVPGNIVTNARGGQSYHNYGLAFDVVVMQNKQPVWTTLPANIGAIGVKLGFEWGGNWNGFKDYPHFQMTFGMSIQQLHLNR